MHEVRQGRDAYLVMVPETKEHEVRVSAANQFEALAKSVGARLYTKPEDNEPCPLKAQRVFRGELRVQLKGKSDRGDGPLNVFLVEVHDVPGTVTVPPVRHAHILGRPEE